jgi:hypothetical protein
VLIADESTLCLHIPYVLLFPLFRYVTCARSLAAVEAFPVRVLESRKQKGLLRQLNNRLISSLVGGIV